MLLRNCSWTLCRTSQRLVQVSPAEITSIERRNLVRILSFIALPPLRTPWPSRFQSSKLLYELVSYPVNGTEMGGVRGILLQLLAQLQNVIIHGAGGRIVLISPDHVE